MRRRVMVWLGNAEAVNTDTGAAKIGANLRPYFLQVVCAISRRAAVKFRIVCAVFRQFFVKAARAGQCDHAAVVAMHAADFVKSSHARHQLHAADGRIRHRMLPQFRQDE